MRKRCFVMLLMAVTLMTAGCGSGKLKEQNESLSAQNESLTAQNESLSAENEKLAADLKAVGEERDQAAKELDSLKSSMEAAEKEATVQQGDIGIEVVDKKSIPKDIHNGIFNDRVQLDFLITNNTNKAVQGIEGIVKIKDLFGKEITKLECDFTGHIIQSGEAFKNDEMAVKINPFMSDDMQLYTTDFKDLKFEYTVKQIVFEDGTVKE